MSRKDDPQRDASEAKKADLEQRLAAKLAEQEAKNRPPQPQGWALGWRYGSEFIAGVVAGLVIGFLIDHFAGTTPWGLVGGMMLGFTVGAYNVVRAANELNKPDTDPDE